MAREMAAAAVGLRGSEARAAMTRAKHARAAERWAAISKAAVRRADAINERDVRQLRARVRAVLGLPADNADMSRCVTVADQGDDQGIDQGEGQTEGLATHPGGLATHK